MREMLKPTSAIMGLGLGNKIAFITDGRFSGGTHGFVVGHISPEAFVGGPINLIKDGDIIEIDAISNKINLKIDDKEFEKRRKKIKLQKSNFTSGVVKKYINSVSSASEGCVTD